MLRLPAPPPPAAEATPHFPRARMLTLARGTTALSLCANALVCDAVTPLLAPHLVQRFGWSIPQAGLYLAAVCASYLLAAPFCASAVYWLNADAGGARRLKLLMALGWLGSVGGHALLGPAAVGAYAIWPTLIANPVLGVTSAALIVPSLPDLQNGLHPDDTAGRAAVCAAWNGLYSVGSAAGPLISDIPHLMRRMFSPPSRNLHCNRPTVFLKRA